MIDLRPVVFVIGTLITILALAMIIPAIVDYSVGHADWQVFGAASAVTLFVGVSMILTTRSGWIGFNLRQAFVMTNLAWLVIATFRRPALRVLGHGTQRSPTRFSNPCPASRRPAPR